MNEFSAGRFRLTTGEPYPVCLSLFAEGEEVARFTHRDLADLMHVISRAIYACRAALPTRYRHEVD